MEILKWALIMIGTALGTVLAWRFQVPIFALLLLAYAACFSIKLPKTQLAISYLYTGLTFGLGLHFLIGLGGKYDYVGMVVAPLLIWLVLRVIFYGVETKYTLHPNEVLTQIRAEDEAAPYFDESVDKRNPNQTISAWSGDNMGSAAQPDASGQYMRYEYFDGGEIAMGGPTYGEAIFSNKCAFSGVGPSIALSEDGRYAAMTQPSREGFGLLIVDLQEKRVFQPKNPGFWEFDRIENGVIYGRHSPITHNTGLQLSIEKAIASTSELPMVEDNGWWVINYQGREPFKQYQAVTIASKNGAHKVTFVPDLTPFKSNPFLSSQNPEYAMLVDDELLENKFKTKRAEATWINGNEQHGKEHEGIIEGRYLVLPDHIIDFNDARTDAFSIKARYVVDFYKGFDHHTHTDFEYGTKADLGNGILEATGYVLPRSTDWESAEFASYSVTSPWNEQDVTYWDKNAKKRLQKRDLIRRDITYHIDLDVMRYTGLMRLGTNILLVNRANSQHTASLKQEKPFYQSPNSAYASYTLTTSCGITLENVLHEAIWSRCGRYLAVVHFEQQPLVPHKISIIDFNTAIIKNITGSYALPSFIWFDKNMLDFTHLIGINEHLNFGPERDDDETLKLRVSDAEYAKKPYDLLFENLDQRQIEAEKKVAKKKSKEGYSGATVSQMAQHCILFAPNFDTPVLQPPDGEKI
jgi:hypothetical protein